MKIEKEQRTELFDYAIDIIQEHLYNEVMKNLSMIEDANRYKNWYHGLTKVSYPKNKYKGFQSRKRLYNRKCLFVRSYVLKQNPSTA